MLDKWESVHNKVKHSRTYFMVGNVNHSVDLQASKVMTPTLNDIWNCVNQVLLRAVGVLS